MSNILNINELNGGGVQNLLLRRRELMMQSVEVSNPFGYIDDGLSFLLDCEYNCNSERWVDWKRGYTFVRSGDVAFDDSKHALYFNGGLMICSDFQPFTRDMYYTDACFTPSYSTYQVIDCPLDQSYNNRIGIMCDGGYQYMSPGDATSYPVYGGVLPVNNVRTLFIGHDICYQNRVNLSRSGLDYWNGYNHGGMFLIGGSRKPLHGYVYSIRIYNRKLNPDEIEHNYNIDTNRFSHL